MNKKQVSFLLSAVGIVLGFTYALAAPSPIGSSTGIKGPGAVPIGGMVAVMPSTHANAWQPPTSGEIKDGFMRADGATIDATDVSNGSLFPAGTVLPNMKEKYPRGNITSGSTGGANTQASNVTFGSSSISTSSGAASFNKNVMNTDGVGHSHGLSSAYAKIYPGGLSNSIFVVSKYKTIPSESQYRYSAYNVATDHSAVAGVTTGTELGGTTDSGTPSWNSATVSTTFTNPTFNQNLLSPTNNAVNNEPAYVEVVWVIRVK